MRKSVLEDTYEEDSNDFKKQETEVDTPKSTIIPGLKYKITNDELLVFKKKFICYLKDFLI